MSYIPSSLIENVLSNNNKTLHVSVNGSDTNNGSYGNPLATITQALTLATPFTTILVYPGVHSSLPFTIPTDITIKGIDQDSVILEPINPNIPFITMENKSALSFLRIRNVNEDTIVAQNNPDYAIIHKIYLTNCLRAVKTNASVNNNYFYGEYFSADDIAESVVLASSSNGFQNITNFENSYSYFNTIAPTEQAYKVEGSNSFLTFHSGTIDNVSGIGGKAFLAEGGGKLNIRNVEIKRFAFGIQGRTNADIVILSSKFESNTYDVDIVDADVTGYYEGYSEYGKIVINNNSNFFITNRLANVITVSKKGADFTTISDALAAITDNSASKIYNIEVDAGIYQETSLTLKPYVFIRGASFTSTIIESAVTNTVLINASPNSGLFTLQVRGATGVNGKAIQFLGGAGVFRCLEVRFGQNTNFYTQNSTNGFATSIFQNCSAEATSNFTTAFEITDNGVNSSIFAFNGFTYTGNGDNFIKAYGVLTQISCANFTISKPLTSGNGIHIYNGAICSVNAATIIGFSKGIYNENLGTGSTLFTNAISIRNCTIDIEINNPNTDGSINAFATRTKIIINPSSNMSVFVTDVTGDGTISLGKLWLGEKYSEIFDAKDLITSGAMGLHEGGELSTGSGFTINVTRGYGYLEDDSVSPEIYKRVSWNNTSIVLSANEDVYVYFNINEILTSSSVRPNNQQSIILGRVVTNSTGIEIIEQSKSDADHTVNKISTALRNVFGVLFSNGGLITTNNSRQFSISSGRYYLGEIEVNFNSKSFTENFIPIYRSATVGQWVILPQTNVVDNTIFDDGSGTLVSPPINNYVKHTLYLTVNQNTPKVYLVIGQNSFTSLSLAEQSPLNLIPSWFREHTVILGSVITSFSTPTFLSAIDLRPRPASASSSNSGTNNHSALINLDVDSHLQYLPRTGSRPMTGNLDMGNNNITNINLVKGVDVSAHASRHLPNGSDPLPTNTPLSIGFQNQNEEGISNTFARGDHKHKVIPDPFLTTSNLTLTESNPRNIILLGGNLTLNDGVFINKQEGDCWYFYNTFGEMIPVYRTAIQATVLDLILPYHVFVLKYENGNYYYFQVPFSSSITKVRTLEFFDDFIAATTAGQTNWTASVNGAGASVSQTSTVGDFIGELTQSTGTTAAGRASTVKNTSLFLIATPFYLEWKMRIPILSTPTERFNIRIGLGDNTNAGDMTDGVYFEYDESISPNWIVKTSSNNVRTSLISNVPVQANVNYTLRIYVTVSRVYFWIGETVIGTINTNIPTGAARQTSLISKIEKTIGTTARTNIIDYCLLKRITSVNL